MDESSAVNLALDAVQTLKDIDVNVSHIGDMLRAHMEQVPELVQPTETEVDALAINDADDAESGWTTVVTASEPLPDNWASDFLHFQYMHTVLFVAMLVALLLNLGATLWLAVSDKWR